MDSDLVPQSLVLSSIKSRHLSTIVSSLIQFVHQCRQCRGQCPGTLPNTNTLVYSSVPFRPYQLFFSGGETTCAAFPPVLLVRRPQQQAHSFNKAKISLHHHEIDGAAFRAGSEMLERVLIKIKTADVLCMKGAALFILQFVSVLTGKLQQAYIVCLLICSSVSRKRSPATVEFISVTSILSWVY